MKLEDRVEAAATALRGIKSRQETYEWHAREVLRAAFPELFTTPPQAWIAPWEATETMFEAGYPHAADPCWPEDFRKAFGVMRDAHLSQSDESLDTPPHLRRQNMQT